MDYTLRTIEHLDWITYVLVGTFGVLALTRWLYPRRFYEFMMLPITDKYFALQGKGYEIKHPFNVALFGIQVVSFSLFIYLILLQREPEIPTKQPWLYIQLLTGVSIFLFGKYVIEKMIANIFNMEAVVNSYLYEKLSYASLISLLALVFNILFFYAIPPNPLILWVFAGTILVLFVISLISSFKRNANLILRYFFYFILYLCALEIAPFIVLYKLLD
ncbi:DUF4271 domain-containing protein [Aureisphaera galaxeae]|uniref:DUF4271 domain-containing protein n=1 Tax=Aureisphaera galaxeae TaxID=1538023 RepID=UPI0023504496|nr:DUF4271 domain-containing protein [Aureisphaera galaxeae]MDC8002783.1 DUF4271 domain-containing protein [Aureisphaera galaxeae]